MSKKHKNGVSENMEDTSNVLIQLDTEDKEKAEEEEEKDKNSLCFAPFDWEDLSTHAQVVPRGDESISRSFTTEDNQIAPDMLEPTSEINNAAMVTDNSCANLLDFDVLSGAADATDAIETAQSGNNTAGNWDNFKSLGEEEVGGGGHFTEDRSNFALGLSLGTTNEDALIGDVSPLSSVPSPELLSSEAATPEEDNTSLDETTQGHWNSRTDLLGDVSDTEKEAQSSSDLTSLDTVEKLSDGIKVKKPAAVEVNPIDEAVNSPFYPPNDSDKEVSFDQQWQAANVSKSEEKDAPHMMASRKIAAAEFADSGSATPVCPFTPPNSVAEGFQPTQQPYELLEESLREKIAGSLPVDNVKEESTSSTGDEDEELVLETEEAQVMHESCTDDTVELLFDSTGKDPRPPLLDLDTPDTDDNPSINSAGAVPVPANGVAGQEKPQDNKTAQLLLAMELEETAIDDDDDADDDISENDTDFSEVGHEIETIEENDALFFGENTTSDQAIDQQIIEAIEGEIALDIDPEQEVSLASVTDVDSLRDSEASLSLDLSAATDAAAIKTTTGREPVSGEGENTNTAAGNNGPALFIHDEDDDNDDDAVVPNDGDNTVSASGQVMPPAFTDTCGDDDDHDEICHNTEELNPVNTEAEPGMYSRQNYRDLLSEEISVFAPDGSVVTEVNPENIFTEETNEPSAASDGDNGDDDNTETEDNEELREFVENFINEEVLPSALQLYAAEGKPGNSNAIESDTRTRFLEEEESNTSTGNDNEAEVDSRLDDITGLQIEETDGAVSTADRDKTQSGVTSGNAFITQVHLQSQEIFDHHPSAAVTAAQIAQEEVEVTGPALETAPKHEDDINNIINELNDEEFHPDLEVASQVDNDEDTHAHRRATSDTPESEVSLPAADWERGNKSISEASFNTNEGQGSVQEIRVVREQGEFEAKNADAVESLCAVEEQIADEELTNLIAPHRNQPEIVVSEYEEENAELSKSEESSSSWEKESEGEAEPQSSASQSTGTSNEEAEFQHLEESDISEHIASVTDELENIPEEEQETKSDIPEEEQGTKSDIPEDEQETNSNIPEEEEIKSHISEEEQKTNSDVSSEDEDADAVHGAAVEDGTLVYTASTDTEAARKFAQDIILGSLQKHRAAQIVKTATEAAVDVVKAEQVNGAEVFSDANSASCDDDVTSTDESTPTSAITADAVAAAAADDDDGDSTPDVEELRVQQSDGGDEADEEMVAGSNGDATGKFQVLVSQKVRNAFHPRFGNMRKCSGKKIISITWFWDWTNSTETCDFQVPA